MRAVQLEDVTSLDFLAVCILDEREHFLHATLIQPFAIVYLLIVSDPAVVLVLFMILRHVLAKFFLSLRRIVVLVVLFQVVDLIIYQFKLELLNLVIFYVLLFLWRFVLLLTRMLIVMVFQFLIIVRKAFRKTMINDVAEQVHSEAVDLFHT